MEPIENSKTDWRRALFIYWKWNWMLPEKETRCGTKVKTEQRARERERNLEWAQKKENKDHSGHNQS